MPHADAYKLLQLETPAKVLKIVKFSDGGSTGIQLEDSKGRSFKFCIDSRAFSPSAEPSFNLFVGTLEISDAERKYIQKGSKTEKAIMSVLEHCISQDYTPDEKNKLVAGESVKGQQQDAQTRRILHVLKLIAGRPAEGAYRAGPGSIDD